MTELTPMQTLQNALTSAFSTTATDAMTSIGQIVPVALPVLGAIVVVGIAIKIFKKVTGR